MQNNRVLQAFLRGWRWLLAALVLLGLVAGLQSYFKLSTLETLLLSSALGWWIMLGALVVAIRRHK